MLLTPAGLRTSTGVTRFLLYVPVSAPQVQLALGEARDTAERQLAAEERKKGKVGADRPRCCGMACNTHQL